MSTLDRDEWLKLHAELKKCRSPEGALAFSVSRCWLEGEGAESLFFDRAGLHFFHFKRTEARAVEFVHSCPGTGTRVATMPVVSIPAGDPKLTVILRWNRKENDLWIRTSPDKSVRAVAVDADYHIVLTKNNGTVFLSKEVHSTIRLTVGDELMAAPYAQPLWEHHSAAVSLLLELEPKDFNHGVMLCNVAIVMLSAAWEAYCKARFLELEEEGVRTDLNALYAKFGVKDAAIADLEERAVAHKRSPLAQMASTRINFQEYAQAKRAFGKAYGLKFGEIIDSQTLQRIQDLLAHRHKVAHVEPTLQIIGKLNLSGSFNAPEFATVATARDALATFGRLVDAIHAASLQLPGPSKAT